MNASDDYKQLYDADLYARAGETARLLIAANQPVMPDAARRHLGRQEYLADGYMEFQLSNAITAQEPPTRDDLEALPQAPAPHGREALLEEVAEAAKTLREFINFYYVRVAERRIPNVTLDYEYCIGEDFGVADAVEALDDARRNLEAFDAQHATPSRAGKAGLGFEEQEASDG